MITSMTGYSRKDCTIDGHRVRVEIRTVNHRFCEITTHVPHMLAEHEAKIKRIIGQHVARGKVDVSIALPKEAAQTQTLAIDHDVARRYVDALKKLQRDLKLPGEVSIELVAGLRELTTIPPPETPSKVITEILAKILPNALDELQIMRQREGRALARDIKGHIKDITRDVAAIRRHAPRVVEFYKDRLHSKIQHLMKEHPVDDARLSQEIALFATRCDISEELARTASHLDQWKTLMEAGTEVGKTLNFLVQELHREINTMGTKGNDVEIAQRTVAIKASLEKVREQIQNIE